MTLTLIRKTWNAEEPQKYNQRQKEMTRYVKTQDKRDTTIKGSRVVYNIFFINLKFENLVFYYLFILYNIQ